MINVAKLKAKIEARIEELESEHQGRLTDWDEAVRESKQRWRDMYARQWSDAAVDISRSVIQNDGVVTSFMYPGNTWSEPYRDKLGRSKPEKIFRPPTELVQVLNALDMLDESEISHTALKFIGIMPADMAAVGKLLARGAR